jgi:GDPmannose 4,6-dehydratase
MGKKEKKALITGPYGQDGSYLSELLTHNGYEVHGIVKKKLSENSLKIKKYINKKNIYVIQHYSCLNNYFEIEKVIAKVKPDEIYHLAATHYSSELSSKDNDRALYKRNVTATFNILASAMEVAPKAKIVLAGSCLVFDSINTHPQVIKTPFKSRSFYGLAKISEHQIGKFFRDLGMHISVAILYNHESPRRASNFVTRKIIINLIKIKENKQSSFELGCLNTKKDWGYAKDYVRAMWLMAQQKKAQDYIISTGITKTIKDFVDSVAIELGIEDWKPLINVNQNMIERRINNVLVGDSSYTINQLGWKRSITFKQLVSLMVKSEISGSLD